MNIAMNIAEWYSYWRHWIQLVAVCFCFYFFITRTDQSRNAIVEYVAVSKRSGSLYGSVKEVKVTVWKCQRDQCFICRVSEKTQRFLQEFESGLPVLSSNDLIVLLTKEYLIKKIFVQTIRLLWSVDKSTHKKRGFYTISI